MKSSREILKSEGMNATANPCNKTNTPNVTKTMTTRDKSQLWRLAISA
jgi:hypothetical protein